jgi:hypothetical protein
MKQSLLTCLVVASICVLPSCGGSSGYSGSDGGGSSSTPSITSISPAAVPAGGPAFTLTVNGKNFTNGTTVQLSSNGTVESGVTTTFVSDTKLTAAVPASAIVNFETLSVELLQDGNAVSSKGADLTVGQGTPVITSISPTTVVAGGPAFTLTINGSYLGGVITWMDNNENTSGFDGATPVGTGSQITVTIPAGAITYPGTAYLRDTFYEYNSENLNSNFVALTITPAPAGFIQTIVQGANGAVPNGPSSMPAVGDTGREVAFASQATNLITGGTNFQQVYLSDDCIGAPLPDISGSSCTPSTMLVSAESSGVTATPMEGNGPSTGPSFSAQEPVEIGFLSAATNLVLPNTTSQQGYLRNTCIDPISSCSLQTFLVTSGQNTTLPNAAATDLVMDSEACNGVFASSATNIIAGVTIPNEVYYAECDSETVNSTFSPLEVVSASSAGVPGNQGGSQPAISGALVVYSSMSTNLTSTPTGGFQQIYLSNTCTNQIPDSCGFATNIISVDSSGNALQGNSENPAISDDERFVTFTMRAPQSGGGTLDTVYRYDDCASTLNPSITNCTPGIAVISVGAGGATANGSSDSGRHALSEDGRLVAFHSNATNLIAGGNPAGQVFVRDTCVRSGPDLPQPQPPANCTPSTNMVSINNGVAIGGSQEAISADGHFVVFVTTINSVQQVVLAYTGF